jgi:hypothetical protein
MGELATRGSYYTPDIRRQTGAERRASLAIRGLEAEGRVRRAADIEVGRRAANQIDVVNAVGAHASERHADFVRYQRDLAAGDAGIELELAPIRGAVLRKSVGTIDRLFGVL